MNISRTNEAYWVIDVAQLQYLNAMLIVYITDIRISEYMIKIIQRRIYSTMAIE